jgi:hypothetical protein
LGPFDLDPCADHENAKAPTYYTGNGCGLDWYGGRKPWCVFVNPPFNRKKKMYVGPWVEKALTELDAGHCSRIVMVLPAKTDVKWWQQLVMTRAKEVYFVEGRVKFVQQGKDNCAPFPSAIVLFEPGWNLPPEFDIFPRSW